MVGRFIKDQHIRLRHQCLRQRHALALPAGHVADAFVGVQFQLGDCGLDARFDLPAVLRLKLCLQMLHLFQQLVVVRVRLRELVRNMVVIVQQLLQLAHTFGHRVEHGVVYIQHRLLTDVANACGGRAPHLAVIQRSLPGQHTHHAGLAAAVAPDQPDAFAFIELKVGMIQQGDVPECKARLVQGNKWHERLRFCCSFYRKRGLIYERYAHPESGHGHIHEIDNEHGDRHLHEFSVNEVDRNR